jgi:hypothetical protein
VSVPRIGLGVASDGTALTPSEGDRLAMLRPAHLRVDLHPSQPGWNTSLERALGDAVRLGTRLEVALFLTNCDGELADVAERCAGHRDLIARWLVFGAKEQTTRAGDMPVARRLLGPLGAPIGGGTNADLYQLCGWRPEGEVLDFIVFSMNPQVHACDTASIAEALTAIPYAVRSAVRWFPDRQVVVSPLTLKPRFNAVATSAPDPVPVDALPPEVDPRQMSLFGAGWTLGTVIALSVGHAASITLYETTGWRGVIERKGRRPRARLFPSIPGGVFPLFHVLADVAEFVDGHVTPLVGTGGAADARAISAAVLTLNGQRVVLAANLTGHERRIEADVLAHATWRRSLTGENADRAMRDPAGFRRERQRVVGGTKTVVLRPFEYARLDL